MVTIQESRPGALVYPVVETVTRKVAEPLVCFGKQIEEKILMVLKNTDWCSFSLGQGGEPAVLIDVFGQVCEFTLAWFQVNREISHELLFFRTPSKKAVELSVRFANKGFANHDIETIDIVLIGEGGQPRVKILDFKHGNKDTRAWLLRSRFELEEDMIVRARQDVAPNTYFPTRYGFPQVFAFRATKPNIIAPVPAEYTISFLEGKSTKLLRFEKDLRNVQRALSNVVSFKPALVYSV